MNTTVDFHEFSIRKEEIQQKAYNLIASNNPSVLEDLRNRLQECEDAECLKIAFVGQHNAGKSSIISALTGNKAIKISTNVETDTATDYEWNGVLLTDTPGLYAGVKEQHDTITLKKIEESDLLVFCITSSLFDDLLINSFVELAYKKMYKNKIMLVVNKMSQEFGSYDELVCNYKQTLEKTLSEAGGFANDFKTVFVDAHDFIEGQETNDDELIECSRFEDFICEINAFINERGYVAKLDTPCRVLDSVVSCEISDTGTEIDKAMMSLIKDAENTIYTHKRDSAREVKDRVISMENAARMEANALISRIGEEKIGDGECNEVNKKIEEVIQKASEDIQDIIDKHQSEVSDELHEIWNSDMAHYVLGHISSDNVFVNAEVASDFSRYNEAFSGIKSTVNAGGEAVLKMAGGAQNINGYVTALSGTSLHKTVLDVGHFFGVKFKPYGALHIAEKLGKVAKCLGPTLTVLTTIFDIAGKFKSESDNKKIDKARRDALEEYGNMITDIGNNLISQYKEFENVFFDSLGNEISATKTKIINSAQASNDYVNELKLLHGDLMTLISDIASV